MIYYKLYCDFCNYKLLTNEKESLKGLLEVNRTSIQSKVPFYNYDKNHRIEPTWIQRSRRLKCPNCGRLIKPKKIEENEKDNPK